MIHKVIIRFEAKQDLREAKAWYRNISRELGRDFVRRIDDAVALAQERPLAFRLSTERFEECCSIGFRMRFSITLGMIASLSSPYCTKLAILKFLTRENHKVESGRLTPARS